jgi:hypothetical protein
VNICYRDQHQAYDVLLGRLAFTLVKPKIGRAGPNCFLFGSIVIMSRLIAFIALCALSAHNLRFNANRLCPNGTRVLASCSSVLSHTTSIALPALMSNTLCLNANICTDGSHCRCAVCVPRPKLSLSTGCCTVCKRSPTQPLNMSETSTSSARKFTGSSLRSVRIEEIRLDSSKCDSDETVFPLWADRFESAILTLNGGIELISLLCFALQRPPKSTHGVVDSMFLGDNDAWSEVDPKADSTKVTEIADDAGEEATGSGSSAHDDADSTDDETEAALARVISPLFGNRSAETVQATLDSQTDPGSCPHCLLRITPYKKASPSHHKKKIKKDH